MRADVLALYRSLGGRLDRPALRPGAWDRALVGGDVVELDEELHFNRYRARTLEWSWSRGLPWRDAHLAMCRAHESKCVSAGSWGKRWTNPSSELERAVATSERQAWCWACRVLARPHGRRVVRVRDLPAAGRPVTCCRSSGCGGAPSRGVWRVRHRRFMRRSGRGRR